VYGGMISTASDDVITDIFGSLEDEITWQPSQTKHVSF